eukprot:5337189-Amphidinium_carterae.2
MVLSIAFLVGTAARPPGLHLDPTGSPHCLHWLSNPMITLLNAPFCRWCEVDGCFARCARAHHIVPLAAMIAETDFVVVLAT